MWRESRKVDKFRLRLYTIMSTPWRNKFDVRSYHTGRILAMGIGATYCNMYRFDCDTYSYTVSADMGLEG